MTITDPLARTIAMDLEPTAHPVEERPVDRSTHPIEGGNAVESSEPQRPSIEEILEIFDEEWDRNEPGYRILAEH